MNGLVMCEFPGESTRTRDVRNMCVRLWLSAGVSERVTVSQCIVADFGPGIAFCKG